MMSQLWKIGTLAAIGLVAVASVAAQQPPAQQPPTQPPAAAAAAPASPGQVVVTGCIQRTAQLPVGTSGTTNPIDATKFILTKASSAAEASAAPKTYRLDAEESALTAHVGHKVEITGTLDAAKPTAAVAGDPAPPAAAAASPSKLKVASVKMVAASCSE
jgi:hypothetical protein